MRKSSKKVAHAQRRGEAGETPSRSQRRQTLDANLKKAFDETAQEPLPDRFVELLKELRSKKEV